MSVRRTLRKINQALQGSPPAAAPVNRLGRIAAQVPRTTAGSGRSAGVRVPIGLHAQAARPAASQLAYRPGYNGSGMQPTQATPIQAYTGRASGVPLTGGQGQVVLTGAAAGSGTGTVVIGPQGLGTTWYPAQATISTTSGVTDTSTLNVYLGAQGVPVLLVGTVFPGGAGTVALAIPDMQPGQYLIFIWTGGNPGDTATANVIGTMDALSQ